MEKLVEVTVTPLSQLVSGEMNNGSCLNNCSGHGECINGVCVCEIQFEGEECRRANSSYFVGFASVFFTLALVCLVQLVMCVLAEWQRMKAPSLLHACRVTTQKLLYFVVFLASILRGAYFTSPTGFEGGGWSSSLMSAYYPLLLSGSSLIVCFWAEVFHLRDIRWEKSRFLSKSFLAFVTFNLIAYSLLVAEFYTIHYLDTTPELKNFYIHVFNGCYAVLLFIVVVFFLIYGVQVFVKVRGGFLLELENSSKKALYRQLFRSQESLIDTSQLQQSRLGLVSQTLMLSFVVVFLCSETLSDFWKYRVPLHSRNWHDLLFRVVEIGVALWFPCVLWNCMSPEQLWILNPKRIIKNLDLDVYQLEMTKEEKMESHQEDAAASLVDSECFICRDPTERLVCCCCYAHQRCLREWCRQKGQLSCQTCHKLYPVVMEPGKMDWRAGFTPAYFRRLCFPLLIMVLFAIPVWQVWQEPVAGPLSLLFFLLVLYVCVKWLWQYTDIALKEANKAGLRVTVVSTELLTLSETVFHLRDIRWEKSRFLSKSFLAFVTFNLIAYSLLVAEFYTIHYLDTTPELKNFYIHVFNGCYAVLLFIVVVFFLIYGVQVFVKVRGGFLLELENSSKKALYRQLFRSQESLIDTSQLQQSRLGLVSQTLMLSFVVVFLCSETLSDFWKYRVPLHSRNWHDLLFRVVEIGVALWFPCVLWNCMSPEQLWILNPKRIIKNLDLDVYQLEMTNEEKMESHQEDAAASLVDSECFICRDPTERLVCCCCYAHQRCLREWCRQKGQLSCQTCHKLYPVVMEPGKMDWRAGFTPAYFRRLCFPLLIMVLFAIPVWQVWQEPVAGPLSLLFFLLVLYVCVKWLWQYTDIALKEANKAGLRVTVVSTELLTLSETVTLEQMPVLQI